MLKLWCGYWESNPALSLGKATYWPLYDTRMEPISGVEPLTYALRKRRSTN